MSMNVYVHNCITEFKITPKKSHFCERSEQFLVSRKLRFKKFLQRSARNFWTQCIHSTLRSPNLICHKGSISNFSGVNLILFSFSMDEIFFWFFYQIDLFGWSWWFLASARISFESRWAERFKLSHRFIHYYYYDYSKRVWNSLKSRAKRRENLAK